MTLRHWVIIAGCAITAIHLIHQEQDWIVWILFVLLGMFTFHFRRMRRYGWLMVASLLLFSFLAKIEMEPQTIWENGEQVELSLRFTDFLTSNGYSQTTIVKTADGEKLLFRSSIQEDQLEKFIQPGIVCKINGVMEEPSSAANFNAFSYRHYLHSQDVFWIFEAESFQRKDCDPDPATFSFTSLQLLQESLKNRLKQSLPSPTKELVLALLLGDRDEMNQDVTDAYEKLGIVHLLAISGLHVGLLSAVLFRLGIRIGMTREGVSALLLMVLPIYAVLSGAAPSVIRAVCMASFVLLCYLIKLGQSIVQGFFISFTIILMFQPFSIYSVGFQLSYGVTFSLLLSIRYILSFQRNSWKSSLIVSIVAFIASLPLLLYHFFSFSPYSILLNLFYVPLFSVILLPLSWVLALLVMTVGSAPAILVEISNILIQAANGVALFVNEMPISSLVLGRPSLIQLLIILIGFLLVFVLMERSEGQWPKYLFVITFIYFSFMMPKMNGEITAMNVGQGDAILINLPFNEGTYLIDSGRANGKEDGGYIAAEAVIIPYLHSLGITQIDKLLITHGDADHAGGALVLMNNLQINELVIGKKFKFSDLEIEIMGKAQLANIPIKIAEKGDSWKTWNGEYAILAPEGNEGNENDSSIVLHASIRDDSFLFTGDISMEQEEKLVSLFPNLTADYLKVSHHGSQTSTAVSFLKAVSPNFAVISAGKNNWYGHPHQEVLKKLKEEAIEVFRTDQNGAIQYKLNLFSKGTIVTVLP